MQKSSTSGPAGTKTRNKVTYVPKQLPDDPEAFVRLPTLVELSGKCRTAVLNDIKLKKIAPGRLISPRCRVWTVAEVREMLSKLKSGCEA